MTQFVQVPVEHQQSLREAINLIVVFAIGECGDFSDKGFFPWRRYRQPNLPGFDFRGLLGQPHVLSDFGRVVPHSTP